MDATQVKDFFERVASEWDSMRLAWYDVFSAWGQVARS